MGKRKNKCYAVPKSMHKICDGCKTNSTKCPYRDKYRDLRNTRKQKQAANKHTAELLAAHADD